MFSIKASSPNIVSDCGSQPWLHFRIIQEDFFFFKYRYKVLPAVILIQLVPSGAQALIYFKSISADFSLQQLVRTTLKNIINSTLSIIFSSHFNFRPELLEQLWKARAEKKKLRKTLREFEEAFYQQNGRFVENHNIEYYFSLNAQAHMLKKYTEIEINCACKTISMKIKLKNILLYFQALLLISRKSQSQRKQHLIKYFKVVLGRLG